MTLVCQIEEEARQLAARQRQQQEELKRRARRKDRYAALVKEMYMPAPDTEKVAELQERVYKLHHPVGDRKPHLPDYNEPLRSKFDKEGVQYSEALSRRVQPTSRSTNTNSPSRKSVDSHSPVYVPAGRLFVMMSRKLLCVVVWL